MWSVALAWQIEFEDAALKELAKLDKPVARRIVTFLRERVAERWLRFFEQLAKRDLYP